MSKTPVTIPWPESRSLATQPKIVQNQIAFVFGTHIQYSPIKNQFHLLNIDQKSIKKSKSVSFSSKKLDSLPISLVLLGAPSGKTRGSQGNARGPPKLGYDLGSVCQLRFPGYVPVTIHNSTNPRTRLDSCLQTQRPGS